MVPERASLARGDLSTKRQADTPTNRLLTMAMKRYIARSTRLLVPQLSEQDRIAGTSGIVLEDVMQSGSHDPPAIGGDTMIAP